jgi:hypothetical protein
MYSINVLKTQGGEMKTRTTDNRDMGDMETMYVARIEALKAALVERQGEIVARNQRIDWLNTANSELREALLEGAVDFICKVEGIR